MSRNTPTCLWSFDFQKKWKTYWKWKEKSFQETVIYENEKFWIKTPLSLHPQGIQFGNNVDLNLKLSHYASQRKQSKTIFLTSKLVKMSWTGHNTIGQTITLKNIYFNLQPFWSSKVSIKNVNGQATGKKYS